MGFFHKEPYECKMLETYKIDIEKTNNIYKANHPSVKTKQQKPARHTGFEDL